MTAPIDYSAFSAPEPPTTRRVRVIGWGSLPGTHLVAATVAAFVLGIPTMIVAALQASTDRNPVLSGVYVGLAVAILVTTVGIVAVDAFRDRNRHQRLVPTSSRVADFARDNGWEYQATGSFARLPGLFFENHAGSSIADRVTGSHGTAFDLGSFGQGDLAADDAAFFGGGYFAMRMQRSLPHLFLVPTSASVGDTVLERAGLEETAYELEGDFTTTFTLHIAPGFERDALYILTPDVMASLVDGASDFFVETFEDWVIVCSNEPFVGRGEELYRQLFGILESIGAEAGKQSAGFAPGTTLTRIRQKPDTLNFAYGAIAVLVGLPVLVFVPWGISQLLG